MYRLGFGLVPLAILALWLYCIFDVIASDEALVRNLPRTVWLILVIFIPTIGSVAWLALGRPLYAGWRPGDTTRRPPPPRRVVGPEDLPDFPTSRPDDDRERRLREWEDDLRRRERGLRPDDKDGDEDGKGSA
ncbi:MAG TPA: PLD nuclease N-terminal domain-containing protein [Acidimicrobiia bacterium]|nr:PLD nuclease N-terminal domain-containing protein [Acidimicrobiia bacterium]